MKQSRLKYRSCVWCGKVSKEKYSIGITYFCDDSCKKKYKTRKKHT